jgi:hypothetical protein
MARLVMLSEIQMQVQIPPLMMMGMMRNPPRRVLPVLPSRRPHLCSKHLIVLWQKVNYKYGRRNWVLDSGCIQHMTETRRMFTSIDNEGSECDKITFGDNSKGKVKGLGKIAISNDLSILNVLLVESLSYNLLSIAQLCDLGLICKFSLKDAVITSIKSDKLIF